MTEKTIVRENLMNEKGYSPYCGNGLSRSTKGGCDNPRTKWSSVLNQFICPKCGWISEFPQEFIKRYKEKWGLV
jgi:hypothetical protein